jgi:hypothetical protein
MRQGVAFKDHEESWALDILSGLKETLPSHAVYFDHLIERFPADYQRIAEISNVLFGSDISRYGESMAAIFDQWEIDGGPILPAFQARAFEYFNLPRDGPAARAAMAAAMLAEIPNDLLYHGNLHYRKVLAHTIRLMASQMDGNFPYQPLLYNDDLTTLLIAATIHDLGHEGGDNMRTGIYMPGYMEQKAFDLAYPILEAVGLEEGSCRDIETLIFCTDITLVAGDNSPCVRMKNIYRHFFLGGIRDGRDMEVILVGKMRRFENNPRLSILAMLLHEADIASSAGMTYDQSKLETVKFLQERGLDSAGPRILLKFLSEQLGGNLTTPAAQQIFGGQMESIMRQASLDLENGLETF